MKGSSACSCDPKWGALAQSRAQKRLLCLLLSISGLFWVSNAPAQVWEDDAFILDYPTAPDSTALARVDQRYGCTAHVVLNSRCVKFVLPDSTDEAAVVADADTIGLDGAPDASLAFYAVQDDFDTIPFASWCVAPALRYYDTPTTDEHLHRQWQYRSDLLNIADAWERTTGDAGTVVVLIDTGLDTSHVDTRVGERPFRALNIVSAETPEHWWEDPFSHGTAMASLIWAAHEDGGLAGVAPDIELRFIKVGYEKDGYDDPVCPLWAYEAALDSISTWAQADPFKNFVVLTEINYTQDVDSEYAGRIFKKLKADFVDSDLTNVLFVSPSGNDVRQKPDGSVVMGWCNFPAGFSGSGAAAADTNYSPALDLISLAVSAVTPHENYTSPYIGPGDVIFAPAAYASWASRDSCELVVDLAGPGGGNTTFAAEDTAMARILVAYPQDYVYPYRWITGTSPASALLAGAAALVWSARPSLTAQEVKMSLRDSCDRVVAHGPDYYEALLLFHGLHSFHGFVGHYEEQCGGPIIPTPTITPSEERSKSLFGDEYDSICSVVAGSGIPDIGAACANVADGYHNIYRVYGDTLWESQVLTDAGEVVFYGDLVIPAGVVLSISGPSHVRVRVRGHDWKGAGADSERIEITVLPQGKLAFAGTILDFQPDGYDCDGDSCWSGITVLGGGEIGDGLDAPSLFMHRAYRGLEVGDGVDLSLRQLILDRCNGGLTLGDSASLLLSGPDSSWIVAEDGLIGVFATGHTQIEAGGPLLISGYDYGIDLENCVNGTVEGSIYIPGAAIDGILVDGGSVTFASGTAEADSFCIEDAAQAGMRVIDGTVSVNRLRFRACQYVGLEVSGASSAWGHNCRFETNGTGLFIRDTSHGEFGNFGSGFGAGGNVFKGSTYYHVSNLNESDTVYAEGNTWWCGSTICCPPRQTKILGSVSTTCQ